MPAYASPRTCPGCAGLVPLDTVWVAFGKFYCSEDCVRKAGVLR